MTQVNTLGTGIVFRNPVPHIVSHQAYFPSVVALDNGDLLATFAIAEAFEAANLHTYVARSTDRGETWSEPQQMFPFDAAAGYSDCARITAFPGGEVVAFLVSSDRLAHPGSGLANPENIGFVPTRLSLRRSKDYGQTWGDDEVMTPPLVGPSFEICASIVPLKDGRWVIPNSTWRGWDGDCPNGMRMVGFVSHDQGQTWPEWLDVMADLENGIIHWEGKILELADGALLAEAWAYDEPNGCDLHNRYSLSRDGGKTWLPPQSTGLQGQTMSLLELPDGRIFSIYRRLDQPGLWANIAHLECDTWVNDYAEPVWGGHQASLIDKGDGNMVHEFNELKFGAPTLQMLDNGVIFLAFWCYEKNVSNIRWFKLTVD